MNTITKSAILEAEKLATLYAGELRGKGFTPKTSPAVTPEKTLRCAGFAMADMRPRFDRLAQRHENGSAPRAVVVPQLFQTPPDLAAYRALLEQLNLSDDDASAALLAAGELDALQNLLEDSTDGLTTWTIDENDIAVPPADPATMVIELLRLSAEGLLTAFDVKTNSLLEVKPANGWSAACLNGGTVQINVQR